MRYIKIAMVASIALFFSMAAFNNVIDFNDNLLAVQHVLSMDTTFQTPVLMKRAITSPIIQKSAYCLIIVWEMMTAAICGAGCFFLASNIKCCRQFNKAKKTASVGLFMGFLLYMLGFIVIGGEWFCMWQSPKWNAQITAGLFINFIMFVLIFLNATDREY